MTAPPPRPRPTNLPDYSDPPVDEVVIGISFMSVSGFSTNHVAKYRDLVKAEFPGLQYQPRLITPLESLTQEGSSAPPSFGPLGFFTQPFAQPSQRTWLVNADDQRVIQIQDDAFLTNWRRRDLKPYPHFEPLLGEFWERFQDSQHDGIILLCRDRPVRAVARRARTWASSVVLHNAR
jgi:uncharacterized protein (TIGR04255 family)